MSFLINLFSPRKHTEAAPDDTHDEPADSPRDDDALSKFFNADNEDVDNGSECGCVEEESLSYEQWRESRKQHLEKYLLLRLVGDASDELVTTDQTDDEEQYVHGTDRGDEFDECSFNSGILDQEFNDTNINVGNSSETPAAQSQSESQESQSQPLETQPALQTPIHYGRKSSSSQTPIHSGSKSSSSNKSSSNKSTEKSSLSINTAEAIKQSLQRGYTGIKRKLGFLTDDAGENGSQLDASSQADVLIGDGNVAQSDALNDDGNVSQLNALIDGCSECSEPRRKRHKVNNNQGDAARRGVKSTVPHLSNASHNTTKLHNVDLNTETLNLDLCQVLHIWGLRSTTRMDTGSNDDSQDSSQSPRNSGFLDANSLSSYQSYEDDGPLNTLYKKVLSIEVVQLHHDNNCNNTIASLSSPTIINLSSAPFPSGQAHLQKISQRQRRHEVKRLKIFFYNKYAESVSRLLQTSGNKLSRYLLSLSNVPPQCIMPLDINMPRNAKLQTYLNNPFGDGEYGAQSLYCICIGNACGVKLDDKRLRFDDQLGVRVVRMPVDEKDVGRNEAVVNSESLRGGSGGEGYYWDEREVSRLIERYCDFRGWSREQQSQTSLGQTVPAATTHVHENAGIGSEVNENQSLGANENVRAGSRANENQASQDSSAGEGTHSGETAHGAANNNEVQRPLSTKPLCMLPNLLEHRVKRVTVYGVVLGFSPPALTSIKQWKMSIVLIDETIPVTTEPRNQGQSGGCSTDNKEVHIPSVTVVVFEKSKSHLPVIKSAGDIVCCRDIFLQRYNNEPQLVCRADKGCEVVAVRPAQFRRPGVELHNSVLPNNWSLSCNCHKDDSHANHQHLEWPFINNLWRWGQCRLYSHPTMSPKCKVSISGLDRPTDDVEVPVSGDITAAVTAIIPCPEHLRRRDTPRGYIRLWDGSGTPCSDPYPSDAVVDSNQTNGDPPQVILVEIEKVLKALSSNDSQNLCAGIVAPISLTGRVVNAKIWEEELWQLIHKEKIVQVGTFVRLRNIRLTPDCLSVDTKSSLTPLPFDAYEVQQLLKDHDARIQKGATTNPTSGILPGRSVTASKAKPAQRQLQMLKEHIRQAPPSTFISNFHILRTIPPFSPASSDSIQNLCCKNKDGSTGFRFAFNISDGSAEIDVICLGAVGEKLIGVKAQSITHSQLLKEKAVKTLGDLVTPGYLYEGEIRSVLGKDRKVYYILKSMKPLQSDV